MWQKYSCSRTRGYRHNFARLQMEMLRRNRNRRCPMQSLLRHSKLPDPLRLWQDSQGTTKDYPPHHNIILENVRPLHQSHCYAIQGSSRNKLHTGLDQEPSTTAHCGQKAKAHRTRHRTLSRKHFRCQSHNQYNLRNHHLCPNTTKNRNIHQWDKGHHTLCSRD